MHFNEEYEAVINVDDSEISLNQLRGTGEVEILSDVVFLLPKPDGKFRSLLLQRITEATLEKEVFSDKLI